jgi:hypothetical protein
MWTYKGVNVYPADMHWSGIRWYARVPWDDTPILKAYSKESMKRLITESLTKHLLVRFKQR